MSSGLLLAFPLESVALRLALALGVALLLLRVVSSWELRSPRARSVLAVSPFVVAAAVIVLSSRDLGLPSVLVPSALGGGSLAVPVADRYLDFAPTGPVIVGIWGIVSVGLIARRALRSARFRRAVLAEASPADPRVAAVVLRLARALGIAPPRALVVEHAIGGAAVLGVRDPLLLLDATTLDRLDDEELEGVIAHELAHVARRDNLLAWGAAIVRDVAFFVPGAGWAVRALHREREAAADLDAVGVTARPAALASGLLRVVEHSVSDRRLPHGCAALAPASTVVDRVELLLADERPTSTEHRTELALAAAVSLVAIAVAVVLPALLVGEEGQRDALGVLVGSRTELVAGAEDAAVPEGRVFAVYRSVAAVPGQDTTAGRSAAVRAGDLFGSEDRSGVALACAAEASGCRLLTARPSLALQPGPIVLVDGRTAFRWQATPVSDAGAGERFAVYWLARLEATDR